MTNAEKTRFLMIYVLLFLVDFYIIIETNACSFYIQAGRNSYT